MGSNKRQSCSKCLSDVVKVGASDSNSLPAMFLESQDIYLPLPAPPADAVDDRNEVRIHACFAVA